MELPIFTLLAQKPSIIIDIKIITYYFPGKRVETSSCSSSPEIEKPPTKTVKFTEPNMADLAEIWKVLNNIQTNTDKLVEKHKVIREQHNDLQKSLEFHITKIEELATENKELKSEVNSLKKSLSQAKKSGTSFTSTCGRQSIKLMISNNTPASTTWKYTVYQSKQTRT